MKRRNDTITKKHTIFHLHISTNGSDRVYRIYTHGERHPQRMVLYFKNEANRTESDERKCKKNTHHTNKMKTD